MLVDGATVYPGEENNRNAYKLVEVKCQRPVPDLACDCAHAELIAQQARLIDGKVEVDIKMNESAMGEGTPRAVGMCDYERPPRKMTEEQLKDALRRCEVTPEVTCRPDDWTPEDVYRTAASLKSETYPRLGRPLVTFKGEPGAGCSQGTAATLHKLPDHPALCPAPPPAQPGEHPGDTSQRCPPNVAVNAELRYYSPS